MPGAPDPLYVAARATLLDALEALGVHREAAILVGAQAVYCHTGAADIAVAEFTTDGDLAIDPRVLGPHPLLEDVLHAAGFTEGKQPGMWRSRRDVTVDLLVPESLGGGGRRSARIPPHGKPVARKVHGLEAALIDFETHQLASLDPADPRSIEVKVAGPAALLVAKCQKISERLEERTRVIDKDALDVLRLLRATDPSRVAAAMTRLVSDPLAGEVATGCVAQLRTLFTDPQASGAQMAARAAAPLEPAETTALSCSVLSRELLDLLDPA